MFCLLRPAGSRPNVSDISFKRAQKDLAFLSKGLAHPTRVKIISILARRRSGQEKINCADIVSEFPHAQSTISQHLKVLRQTGWVQTTVDYPRIFYALTEGVVDYYKWLVCVCTEHHLREQLNLNKFA